MRRSPGRADQFRITAAEPYASNPYGATTYLQASLDKIYECTPRSTHLNTYTGGDVEAWLRSINVIE